ncbi:hypothetical protein MASR1M45_17360 [Candidatus Kapaibacterium sp.]
MKKTKVILTIILISIFWTGNLSYGIEDTDNPIEVFAYYDLNIGTIPIGMKKVFESDEQIIKFVIKCKKDRLIRITKINEIGNEFLIIDADWKAGPFTGYEIPFSGLGIYRSEQDIFLLTIKIKSIEVKSYTQSGKYQISPKITVDYADL